MTTITQVSETMQYVLNEVAEQAGRNSGFIKRQRKLSGASFVQTLVFGWMANPAASLEELSQAAAMCGVGISGQGLEERFTPTAAAFLKQVLEASLSCVIQASGGQLEVLKRFAGLYVQDSTILQLPAELRPLWCGSGNQNGQGAGLKVQTVFDYQAGGLRLSLHPAVANDCPLQSLDMPKGALRLADTAYFDLQRFQTLDERGVYYLSRVPAKVCLADATGQGYRLSDWFQQQAPGAIDQTVWLGQQRLAVRLLAVPVPPEVAAQRREHLQADVHRRRQGTRQDAFALADWTILVTNLPPDRLTLDEALVLIRLRWQIELLFKLWKSQALLNTSRSRKPWRILCEIYAKLLMLVVQHWLLLLGCWSTPDRSLTKAVQTIRKHAFQLAASLLDTPYLLRCLSLLARSIARCRLNKRRSRPASVQLLLRLLPLA